MLPTQERAILLLHMTARCSFDPCAGRSFRGMRSRAGWDDWECAALRGGSFCLPSACRDAPLGQRQGGVFDSPSLPLDSTHPQRVKGCTPLTIPKKKSKHKKLALRQSALSL